MARISAQSKIRKRAQSTLYNTRNGYSGPPFYSPTTSYASLRVGLVSQWKMVAASGADEPDTIGGFTAVASGSPPPASGTLTGSVKSRVFVAATSAYLYVDPSTQYNLMPITIRIWFKTSDASGADLLERYAGGNGWRLFINNVSGDLGFYYYASGNFIDGGYPPQVVNDGALHHVVIVVDATGATYYLDGVLVTGPVAWTGTPTPCTYAGPLNFGGPGAGHPVVSLDGQIGPTIIVNGAWSAAQVALDYQAGPLLL